MRRASLPAVLAALGLVLALGLVAGCAVGPSVRPPVATRDDSPVAPGPPPASGDAPPPPLLPPLIASPTNAISFVDCTAAVQGSADSGSGSGAGDPAARGLRFGCGTVPVSGRGAAGSAELGVLRVTRGPAPAQAVPIAVVGEAGGPTGGEDAIRLATRVPDDVLAGTALYGIDLRGTGTSDPVDCVTPARREAMTDADPTATDPARLAPLRDAAATAARTCSQILENGLTDYRTAVAAEDLDQVRLTLGVDRLHAVGVGEGAGVVEQWAARHPAAAGRLVLDGAPGPNVSSAQSAGERTTAARAALTAFAADCTARPACPLGPDPAGAVTDVLARLHAAPLAGPGGRQVTDGTATTALVAGLGQPSQWPALSSALARARTGDPGGILDLIGPVEGSNSAQGSFDPALAMDCNDTDERLTVDQVAAQAARARAGDPIFGSFFAQQALRCSAWPAPTGGQQPSLDSGPPPLVLGTTGDPSTPLAGAQRGVATMPHATLVTWLGAGHGAYPTTPCVTAVVGSYLLDGNLPRPGTVCPP